MTHDCGTSNIPRISKKSNCSNLWKGVVKAWPHLKNGVAWNLGNGLDVNFCTDRWIPKLNTLDNYVSRSLSEQELKMKIARLS